MDDTAKLFSDLWHRYDDTLYNQSVEVFKKRWVANGEDENFFIGKRCLDVGCGGGRYSIAMSLMGANNVIGLDIGSVEDAKKRAKDTGIKNAEFINGSALDLPFKDCEFDFVCCSGVLHHTPNIELGLREIFRVLKPGGSVFLLLYGSGGIHWALNHVARSIAQVVGQDEIQRYLNLAKVPVNRQRTILDDLFVPILETYSYERISSLLSSAGFCSYRRWTKARLDHEEDCPSLIKELKERLAIWKEAYDSLPIYILSYIYQYAIASAEITFKLGEAGKINKDKVRDMIIGCGHHRIIAQRQLLTC